MNGLTKPSLTRLARRAGVKSVSDDCYDVIRQNIEEEIESIIETAILIIRVTRRRH